MIKSYIKLTVLALCIAAIIAGCSKNTADDVKHPSSEPAQTAITAGEENITQEVTAVQEVTPTQDTAPTEEAAPTEEITPTEEAAPTPEATPDPDLPFAYGKKWCEVIPASEMFLESYFAIIKERLQTYTDEIIGETLINSSFALYDTPYNAADYSDYDIADDKVIFTFSGATLTGSEHPEFTYECDLSEAYAFMQYDLDGNPIHRPEIRELDASKKMIALTFDDGPNVDIDPQLDEVLLRHNARATFFINASRCVRVPDSWTDSVRNLKAHGHEIGSHEYSHLFQNKEDYDREVIWTEVNRSNLILADVTGEAPQYLRLPGGCNIEYFKYLPMPYFYWSGAAADWENRTLKSGETKEDMYARKEDATYNNVIKGAKDGAIILMHVNYPEEPAALERILSTLDKEEYIYVTLSELLYYKGVTPENGKQYSLIK